MSHLHFKLKVRTQQLLCGTVYIRWRWRGRGCCDSYGGTHVWAGNTWAGTSGDRCNSCHPHTHTEGLSCRHPGFCWRRAGAIPLNEVSPDGGGGWGVLNIVLGTVGWLQSRQTYLHLLLLLRVHLEFRWLADSWLSRLPRTSFYRLYMSYLLAGFGKEICFGKENGSERKRSVLLPLNIKQSPNLG